MQPASKYNSHRNHICINGEAISTQRQDALNHVTNISQICLVIYHQYHRRIQWKAFTKEAWLTLTWGHFPMTKILSLNQLLSTDTSKTIQSTTILSILSSSTCLECSHSSKISNTTLSKEIKKVLKDNPLEEEALPLNNSTQWLLSKFWLLRTALKDKIMLRFLKKLNKDRTCSNPTTPTTHSATNKPTKPVIYKRGSKAQSLCSLRKWTQVPHMKIW